MYNIRFLLFLIFLALRCSLLAQPKCFFEYFGTEDGLPQHTVMSIMQDRKGYMWFSTWDGLSKFDGYNFHNYKIQQGDLYHMRTNRIDYICEDKYGFVWTLPYDREVQRFDPRTERFMGLRSLEQYKDLTFTARQIITTPSGKVWLTSDNMGCVCIEDSTFSVQLYNIGNKKIDGKKVYTVYEDYNKTCWILTDNGLYQIFDNSISRFFSEKGYNESKAMQHFYSVAETREEIWFGTGNGKIKVYNKNTKHFRELNIGNSSIIEQIKIINKERILVVSKNDGFYIYDKRIEDFEKYNTSNLSGMRSNTILSSYIDKHNNIWFELDIPGVSKFDLNGIKMKHFTPKVESPSTDVFPPNFFIFEDRNNRVWIHPRGGGFSIYNPLIDDLTPFYNEPSSPNWRFSNMLHAAFSDNQGNLWLSTRSHGLEKITFNSDIFKSNIVDPDVHLTVNNDIRSILEDSNRNVWISAKSGKIYVYDSNNIPLGYLCKDGRIGHGLPLNGIAYCLMEDDSHNLWIGTKGEGIYKLTPTASKIHYNIEQFKHSSDNLYSLSDNNVYSIFQDKQKRVWIGTYGGGLNLVEKDNLNIRFINSSNKLKNYPSQFGSQIRIISSDRYGNIWVGTTLGLIVFSPDSKFPSEIDFRSYIRSSNKSKWLTANDIYDICTTRSGDTYIATFGGGVNWVTSVDHEGFPKEFDTYTIEDGLPSNVVLTIVEDKQANLWIATEGNLSKLNPEKKSFETYCEINRLVDRQNFSEGSRYVTKKGNILFGYSKGFITISPEKIKANDFKPYIALTSFSISNIPLEIGEDSPLKKNIDDISSIKLDHKQNYISIEFAALDYIDPNRIIYAYKLEGADQEWVITKKQRIASYTNLSPGHYTFRVKSTNSDGVWMDNEHSLAIEITPSFWQTGWAYFIYFILFISILAFILRTIIIFYRLKDRVKLEHEETEMKTRFFMDISHEIRTPLTMIVSPVENIVDNEDTPSYIKSQLQLVLKNTNRMLRMVNQILDFRKIQKQKLNLQETKIGVYVSEICDNFTKAAENKNIILSINNQVGETILWVDRDSIEKIIFNLLSNALKNTPVGKRINVNIEENRNNSIRIEVKDEGKGMAKDILNKLFIRFASYNSDKSNPSTGIGLSIVKEIVDKHHGHIDVYSEVNKGSMFVVTLYKGIRHFENDKNIILIYEDQRDDCKVNGNNIINDFQEKKKEIISDNNQTILIVEDDNDLRQFIRTILESQYSILEAHNGEEALIITTKHVPDFIISDIMMPEIDGIELLQQIRINPQTSHIPFILLTAKTDLESKLVGLTYGADDYITKPFSAKYLKARIDNIILQRKKLYNSFINKDQNTQTDHNKTQSTENRQIITTGDKQFLNKIKEEVINNIDNSDFFIDDLAMAMAMSRTVFFKKLKSLTGLAPIEFVRDIKIRYAAELIETQQYTIKEVSFMVGFSDTKYFTQCFKNIFSMTPSEYKNRKKGDNDME